MGHLMAATRLLQLGANLNRTTEMSCECSVCLCCVYVCVCIYIYI